MANKCKNGCAKMELGYECIYENNGDCPIPRCVECGEPIEENIIGDTCQRCSLFFRDYGKLPMTKGVD
jgi:hypothetical protein